MEKQEAMETINDLHTTLGDLENAWTNLIAKAGTPLIQNLETQIQDDYKFLEVTGAQIKNDANGTK